MMKNVYLLFSDTKEFLSDKVNCLGVLVVLLCVINICGFYVIGKELKECSKTVNFRYFNTTRSLEDIHNVKINTKDGTLKFNPHTTNNQQTP